MNFRKYVERKVQEFFDGGYTIDDIWKFVDDMEDFMERNGLDNEANNRLIDRAIDRMEESVVYDSIT